MQIKYLLSSYQETPFKNAFASTLYRVRTKVLGPASFDMCALHVYGPLKNAAAADFKYMSEDVLNL
jgi:hypothetical protein